MLMKSVSQLQTSVSIDGLIKNLTSKGLYKRDGSNIIMSAKKILDDQLKSKITENLVRNMLNTWR